MKKLTRRNVDTGKKDRKTGRQIDTGKQTDRHLTNKQIDTGWTGIQVDR